MNVIWQRRKKLYILVKNPFLDISIKVDAVDGWRSLKVLANPQALTWAAIFLQQAWKHKVHVYATITPIKSVV